MNDDIFTLGIIVIIVMLGVAAVALIFMPMTENIKCQKLNCIQDCQDQDRQDDWTYYCQSVCDDYERYEYYEGCDEG